jgi:hypothetical protein
MYYLGTIRALRVAVEEVEPGVTAKYTDVVPGEVAPLSYLLWMCDEVQKMDVTSIDDAVKAGRWVGWVFAHAELAGLWTNTQTRDHVREDRKNGFDKPHLE